MTGRQSRGGFRVSGLTALVCSGALASCSGSESGCEAVAYEVCDIRDDACQARVFDQVRCLRDDSADAPRPPVLFANREDLEAELGTGKDLTLQQALSEQALSLIGMVEAGDDGALQGQEELETDAVLGYYSYRTGEVTVLDAPGRDWSSVEAVGTLGHEYVHALQDADFGVEAYIEEHSVTFDESLAGISFIEGEATLYEFLLGRRLRGGTIEESGVAGQLEFLPDLLDDMVPEISSPFHAAELLFPYTYGAHRVATAWDDRGKLGITALRDAGGSTSHDYMAVRHGAAASQGEAPFETMTVAGFDSLGTLGLGAWLVHSFVVRSLGAVASHPGLALHWRADELSVFANEARRVGLVWRIRWSDDDRARQFSELINARSPETGLWESRHVDDVSVLIATNAGQDALDAFARATGDR